MALTKVMLRELTAEERHSLERLAASRTAQARSVERARILLAIADGRRPGQVAKDLGLSRPTVPGSIGSTTKGSTDWRIGPGPGALTPIRPSNAPRSSA